MNYLAMKHSKSTEGPNQDGSKRGDKGGTGQEEIAPSQVGNINSLTGSRGNEKLRLSYMISTEQDRDKDNRKSEERGGPLVAEKKAAGKKDNWGGLNADSGKAPDRWFREDLSRTTIRRKQHSTGVIS